MISAFSFKDSSMLLLLLLTPIFIYIVRRSLANISTSKKIIITTLRILAFAMLVFCLAGFSQTYKNDELYVVYLIDVSDSVHQENIINAIKYIRTASPYMKKGDKAAVIVFGKEAVVEIPFSDNIGFFRIASYVNKSHSNIAQAIRIAEVLFPDNVQKKIVLFSDGNQNEGNATREVKAAMSHGVEFLSVMPKEEIREDFLIEKLIIPQNVSVNEPFEAKIVMSGNVDRTATLKIRLDKEEVLVQDVAIQKDKKQVVTFQQTLKKKGAHILNVELANEWDAHVENNSSQGFVFVTGEPAILYVHNGGKKSEDLIKVIEKSKIRVDAITPELLYPSISYLQNYDSVIIDNVPATDFSVQQMKAVQMYVKAVGGGMIMIGGDSSYGLGGYYRTPIEKALPVDMDIEQRKKYARVAMVVIIDKSGSMSYTRDGRQKIDLADEGAINVLEMLFKTDLVGVIACDSVPKWVTPIAPADKKEEIVDKIASIRAGGGGIYVYSSLFEAYNKLRSVEANLKHIILFADSADAEEKVGITGEHVHSLVTKMYADKITVSTIAIGNPGDIDLKFLEDTAYYGNGRFYFTSDMFTLPQIFAKEAFIASKSLVVEEDFTPVAKDFTSILNVDLTKMPPLKGYVITTAKNLATVPYQTQNEDPLLATWQYGLGRVAAFTSDASGRWAARWIGTAGYSSLWSQLVRWSLKNEDSSNYDINLVKKESSLSISVDAVDDSGNFLNYADLKATMVKPDFSTSALPLRQTGSGRYEASGDIETSGTYFINISRYIGDELLESVNAGISFPYLDEYKRFDVNSQFLTHLMNISNGKFFKSAEEIFEHTGEPITTYRTIITPLIFLCIILFVLDATIRKITFSADAIAEIKETLTRTEVEAVPHGYEWLAKKSAGDLTAEEALSIDEKLKDISSKKDKPEPIPPKPPAPDEASTLSQLLKAKKDAKKK